MRESKFSLSIPPYKAFPKFVKDNGKEYAVNADFRNVLRILRMLNDEDILYSHKKILLAEWFYNGDMPEKQVDKFIEFVFGVGAESQDAGEGRNNKPMYDFEFDSEEIYASFIMEYGIDLVEVGFFHWCKFRILLRNLSGKSPFKRKLELRFMNLDRVEGSKRQELEKLKAAVQLPEELEFEQVQEIKEFQDVWSKAGV